MAALMLPLFLLVLSAKGLEERVLTVPEAAMLLRVSPSSYYAAARRGEVPALKIGRRLVVPGVALARILGAEASQSSPLDETGETTSLDALLDGVERKMTGPESP